MALVILSSVLAGCSEESGSSPAAVSQPPDDPVVRHEAPAPEPAFSWSPRDPEIGMEVAFDARADSPSPVTTWLWTFGDGTSASGQHVRHAFSGPGGHTVRLAVETEDGTSASVEDLVTVRAAGSASSSTTSDAPPEPVQEPVIDADVDGLRVVLQVAWDRDPEQVTWSLGDGSTARGVEIEHEYEAPGVYVVRVATQAGEVVAEGTTELELEAKEIRFFRVQTGFSGAEPSIGITSDGTAFVTASVRALRSTDGGQSWRDISDLITAPTTFDPYLWVDQGTDRVYHVNLYVGSSWISWSDDGGDTWTVNPLGGGAGDHQKLATGPPASGNPAAGIAYPNVVYYATNLLSHSEISVSYDGGLTWPEQPVPIPGFCGSGGINGQPHGAPSGTAYLPFYDCDQLWVARSTNNGLTWSSSTVDTTTGAGVFDPDMDSDLAGNTYITWMGGEGDHGTFFSASTDDGTSWRGPYRVSPGNVTTTIFPTVTAGSDGRIAITYYGTQDTSAHPDTAPAGAAWHMYTTFVEDAATSPRMTTVQVTPEPVQVGRICTGGITGCTGDRNLLEFIDSRMDPTTGRLWIVYTDGCGGCSGKAGSTQQINSVARIDEGPSLLADVGWLDPLA